jgi:hypothetical protein
MNNYGIFWRRDNINDKCLVISAKNQILKMYKTAILYYI